MASPKVYVVTMSEDVEPEEELAKARAKAADVGIRLEGSAEKGTFSGTAEGTYVRSGRELTFTVTKKPFFVAWGMIESGLARAFGEVRST